MITNHTRCECRVLATLARGGKLHRATNGGWDTEKRNVQGQTKPEYLQATLTGQEDAVEAARVLRGFVGIRVSLDNGLYKRLRGKGLIDEDGALLEDGVEYLAEIQERAERVMDVVGSASVEETRDAFAARAPNMPAIQSVLVEDTDSEELDEALAETGFGRRGLSTLGCCQGAARILAVIQRFSPQKEDVI